MRPSWQETYFEIAKIVAKRSKDPHTQVGAILVKNGCVIGIGYNGEPRNFKYEFDWNSDEKYTYVIHAELNAIANACSIGANVTGSDIYLTMSPCKDCIKLLIQHQIKNIYYLKDYKDIEIVKQIATNSTTNLEKFIDINKLPCLKCEWRYSMHCPKCDWNKDGHVKTY